MSYIGDSINLLLAVLVGLSVLSTAGVTVYYQQSTTDLSEQLDELEKENKRLHDQNQELAEQIARLQAVKNYTELQLANANESLEARREDIRELTERIRRLEAKLNGSASASAVARPPVGGVIRG